MEILCTWGKEPLANGYYQNGDKVAIRNKGGSIMAITPVQDYTFRPVEYDNICLYDWIWLYDKKPMPRSRSKSKSKNRMYAWNQLSDSESDLDTNSDIASTMSDHVGGGYDTDVEMAEYFDIPHTVYRNGSINDDDMITSTPSPTLQNTDDTDRVTYKGDVSDSDILVGEDSYIDTSLDMEDEKDIGLNTDEEDYNEEQRDVFGYIDPNVNIVRKVKEYFSPSWMATHYMTHIM